MFPAESPLDTTAAFATLLAKIRSGDLASVADLEDLFGPGLRAMLRFRVPQAGIDETARKILHEVLARIFLDTPPIATDQLLGLICETMHRLAPGTGEARPPTRLDSGNTEDILKALLGTTPAERMILERYYLDGRTVAQIAAEMQISESSIRALISRLRADLRSWAHRS